MKNKIILIIAGILFASATAFAFSDLKNDHTYNEAINFIKENNIVQGYPDGTFKPDNRINRAELLKIIIESKFSDDEINNALNEYHAKNYWYVDLEDVDINAWYGPYVRIAIREGIIEGYPDGTFKPSQNVNFVEALKIVLKAYNINYDENTTPWYKSLVEKGAELNLNPLDITAFNLNITRAQMADLITRVLKHQNGTLNNYLKNSSEIKQTYFDIQNGKNNIMNFINRDIEQTEESTATEEPAGTCEDTIIDCGSYIASEETMDNNSNLDCFIDAAKNCCPAKLESEIEIELFGMLVNTKSYREIKGWEDDKCIFYNRTDDQKIDFSDEMRQMALDAGSTEEDIEQQLAESNEASELFIGKDMTCKYPIQDLVDMLENEKEGSFSGSTEDVEKYQCTGSLYE